MTEYLIAKGRIGCVPGVDFGANGEGYIRFCFARSREELRGAVESMGALFNSPALSLDVPPTVHANRLAGDEV